MSRASRPDHLPIRLFRSGFTLFEVLLYVALCALLAGALVTFQWNITQLGVKEATRRMVMAEARLASERLASLLRNAESVDWEASVWDASDGRLVLDVVDTSETLEMRLENGRLSLVSGGGAPVALHSDRTVATELRFKGYRPDDGSVEYVETRLTLRAATESPVASPFAAETTQTIGVLIRQTHQ